VSPRTRLAIWLLRGAAGFVPTASRSDASCCVSGLPAERVAPSAPPAPCVECSTLRAELASVTRERDTALGGLAFLEAHRDHAATVALDRAINSPAARGTLFGFKETTGLS
jgi:hypothetical protein